jgi:hypothetical protein
MACCKLFAGLDRGEGMSDRERRLWTEFARRREARKDEPPVRKRRTKRPEPTASEELAAGGGTTRTTRNRNAASDDARADGTHTTRAKSADRMVQAGGKCESAAVPQCWVTAGATMTRLTAVTFLALITTAHAEPLPQPKTSSCPAGYGSEAAYCVPMRRDAPVAIPKIGQCPSGWTQSGSYCIDTRRR